ncbi:protein ANTAGONIST OF LIKE HETEROCHROMATIN PROTEIN 1-like [Bufo gargarizans]|uniref:protein ANTAGONIST OF LIKE HETEROCHROMATIN PROTEIN 1-like n=1 Tax=Bufo gargarizans TaxID=30331 RepID=UPI001CF2E655|nr:protein ANTAGONIST OF LIKE HETEROCHROMATIN PROTEIN 1-like [Bufo gargarizans]
MNMASFDELLDRVSPRLARMDTYFRRSVSPTERLMLTIRFLATGDSFTSLHYHFRLGISTISTIVKETCQVLWEELHEEFIPTPNQQRWLQIEKKIYEVCQFPHCVGAVDGKHIRIIKPPGTGSEFYNYKKYFLIVLMAIADAEYRFVAVHIGAYGRTNDSMIFKNSFMGRSVYNRRFDFPPPEPMPGTDSPPLPYVLVGDEAFQMSGNLIKPYSSRGLDATKRIFNYRLTRARRMVECTFGILVSKWRVFAKPIQLKIETVDEVVKCGVVLHNFIRTKEPAIERIIEDSEMCSIETFGPRGTVAVSAMRDSFAAYFSSDAGRLQWQDQNV